MKVHKKIRHEEHWSKTGYLSKYMSLICYEQIHRYFTLRDGDVDPKNETKIFTWRVKPITVIIKHNCRILWSPSSHLIIDETMITYKDRTHDKVKLPNKLIKKGYKVWILGDAGYVYDWLWHSRVKGLENVFQDGLNIDRVESKELTQFTKVHWTSTFTLILYLVQRLCTVYSERIFYFFLDNLFLNINVSQALLTLWICCTDTT